MTDFIFMVKDTSYMFVTGPDVVKTVTHEEVTARGAGRRRHPHHQVRRRRPRLRQRRRGAADAAPLRRLPAGQQPREAAAVAADRPIPPTAIEPSLDTLVPDNPDKPYDMKELIARSSTRATSSSCSRTTPQHRHRLRAHGGLDGRHRRQPADGAGRLPRHQSVDQGGALRALLRRFNIPIVTFVDVPGFLPGTAQEYGGIIKHGAKLLYAYAEATVPKVTVITRKAYGGAYDVMASKHLRGDVNFAWPTAEIAVMGPKGAVEIIFRQDIGDAAKIAAHRGIPRPSSPTRSSPAPRLHRRRDHAAHTRKRICRSLRCCATRSDEPVAQARQHSAVARRRGTGRHAETHVQENPHRQPRRDRLPGHQDRPRLGIATVAVYSDADATRCTCAWPTRRCIIGPPPSAESYLVIDKIVAGLQGRPAPRRCIPGYGFLSENAGVREALEASAGIVFIGPPRRRSSDGRQDHLQALAKEAGVSTVPGYPTSSRRRDAVEIAARSAIR
jgi:hypothetical protein